MKRLIQPHDIPSTLWDNKNQLLHLPSPLINEWKKILDQNNLLEKAHQPARKGFVGGVSKEETDEHFAWRFSGSCARTILSFLDPKNELHELADCYAKIFAGNKVFITDLPCGAGAASVSLLSTLAILRKQSVLPRVPLVVTILGGEISPHARTYAETLLTNLRPQLLEQAISIEFSTREWDVCDEFSTTDLNQDIVIKSYDAHSKLVIVTNFSGFLVANGKLKKAKPQLEELFRYSRAQKSFAIWLEPAKNNVKNNFFKPFCDWFYSIFSYLKGSSQNEGESIYAESHIRVQHPLKHDQTFRTNLVVKQFELSKR